MSLSGHPCITAVIPTYRRPALLRRAIKSVLAQTYANVRVCVYDNASGDETAAVVEAISKDDSRVVYHCHLENIGPFKNFVYGVGEVETPYFSILSDDDILIPEFYEEALRGFEQCSEAGFSATNVIHAWKDGHIKKVDMDSWSAGSYGPVEGFAAIVQNGHPTWTGILIKKKVIEEIGFIDLESGCYSDLDFTLRMAARYPFVVSKTPGAVFDVARAETRTPYPFSLFWPGLLNMIKNFQSVESLPEEVGRYGEEVYLARFDKSLFARGIYYLSRGCVDDARQVCQLMRERSVGKARAALLSAVIGAWTHVPLTHGVFDIIFFCFRLIQYFQIKRKQSRYGPYLDLMRRYW